MTTTDVTGAGLFARHAEKLLGHREETGQLKVLQTFEGPMDAVVSINLIHISPWEVTAALMAGASDVLAKHDGGLLYLIQQDSDEIIVVEIEIVGSISVLESVEQLGATKVRLTVIATIDAGNNPQYVVFDPLGATAADLGLEECTRLVTLDLDQVRQVRSDFPFQNDADSFELK